MVRDQQLNFVYCAPTGTNQIFDFVCSPHKGARDTSAQPDPNPQPDPQPEPEPPSEPLPDRCSTNLIFDAATSIQGNLYFFKDR